MSAMYLRIGNTCGGETALPSVFIRLLRFGTSSVRRGLSASGARYTDGVYVFWSKGDTATVYKRDRIVLDNCQLQTAKR